MDVLWFVINILVPMALPSLGPLPLLLVSPAPASYGHAILMTVKDGQLCWGVVAMGLSTIYELAEAVFGGRPVDPKVVFALFAAVFTMLFAVIAAANGAYSPVAVPKPLGVAWVYHYRLLVASLVVAVVNAALFTYVHERLHH